jgi:pimeloyl-ACP methyl ester carboxylesterase
MAVDTIRRGFVTTRVGRIHYAEAGQGDPVLCLHQTPRSWDEYRDVLPLLGARYRAIAMDTIGFGDSARLQGAHSVERYGEGVVALLDALGLERVALVGHHTGGVVAVEVAATQPRRVTRLVLSGTTCVDEEGRRIAATWPPIDAVEPKADGSHLTELWRRRMPYYPKDRPDLLHRLVLDALKVMDHVEDGHVAVDTYRMEERLPRIQCPVMLVCGTEDWAAFPDQERLARYLPGARRVEIAGAGVPLVDQMPERFAEVVLDFLDTASPAAGST